MDGGSITASIHVSKNKVPIQMCVFSIFNLVVRLMNYDLWLFLRGGDGAGDLVWCSSLEDKYVKSEACIWTCVTATSAFHARCDGWREPLSACLSREFPRWLAGERRRVGMKVVWNPSI